MSPPEPVRIEKVLKEHLDDLTDDGLKSFQWYVVNHRADCKPIPKRQLENATREKTVDELVGFYGVNDAVEITVDILIRMNHNNLATRLTQAIIGRNVEQQSHEPLSSAVRQTQRDSDLTITEDLSCSICRDIFTEPVMLQCGHSFCRTCVHKQMSGQICPKCSLCNQVIQIDPEPQINYALKSLIESCRKNISGHRNDVYQTPSRSITEKREAFEKVKQFCDSSIEQIKNQRHNAEKKIKDDFEKLQLMLKREEETRIAELEEEATQKIGMMQKITEISRDTFSLSDTVKDMQDLGADNSFVQNFRTEIERAQNALPDPQLLPQALINVSKHVENLQCRVVENMLSNVKYRCIVTIPVRQNHEVRPVSPIKPLSMDEDEDKDNEEPRFLDNNYEDNKGHGVLVSNLQDNEGLRFLDDEDNEGPPDFLSIDVELPEQLPEKLPEDLEDLRCKEMEIYLDDDFVFTFL